MIMARGILLTSCKELNDSKCGVNDNIYYNSESYVNLLSLTTAVWHGSVTADDGGKLVADLGVTLFVENWLALDEKST